MLKLPRRMPDVITRSPATQGRWPKLTAKAPATIATETAPRGVALLPGAKSICVTNNSRRLAGTSGHGCPAHHNTRVRSRVGPVAICERSARAIRRCSAASPTRATPARTASGSAAACAGASSTRGAIAYAPWQPMQAPTRQCPGAAPSLSCEAADLGLHVPPHTSTLKPHTDLAPRPETSLLCASVSPWRLLVPGWHHATKVSDRRFGQRIDGSDDRRDAPYQG